MAYSYYIHKRSPDCWYVIIANSKRWYRLCFLKGNSQGLLSFGFRWTEKFQNGKASHIEHGEVIDFILNKTPHYFPWHQIHLLKPYKRLSWTWFYKTISQSTDTYQWGIFLSGWIPTPIEQNTLQYIKLTETTLKSLQV